MWLLALSVAAVVVTAREGGSCVLTGGGTRAFESTEKKNQNMKYLIHTAGNKLKPIAKINMTGFEFSTL